ncbi:MAG: DNA translocase FtsK 4TM domain-containing protein [Thermodesulfovibrionales bacterium]|nr:DNA translocase FtsK 4TM domain-containing protein [Thermodesulfovibrionales bacterium]
MQQANNTLVQTKSKRRQEITGVIAVLGSLYIAVSLFTYNKWDTSVFTFSANQVKNYGGIAGAHIADIILSAIGLAGFMLPLFLSIYGVRKILGKERNMIRVLGVLIFLSSLSILLQLLAKTIHVEIDPPGGLLGIIFSNLFENFLSKVGAYILNIALMLISIILMSPVSPFSYLAGLKHSWKQKQPERHEVNILEHSSAEETYTLHRLPETPAQPFTVSHIPRFDRDGSYRLPSMELLKDAENIPGPSKEELNEAASGLEKKLYDFGVNGKIKQAHPGPVVTMYEFEPAAGVKINRIVSLSDDLALALRAQSIRVYPIAGKATIGIEVPNRQRATVCLKEIISSDIFMKSPSLLSLALGKDIFGNPLITDMSKMPHLLVAGATGSGKSISINAMIISLLYKASPDEVKMLLIDPKLLELSAYSDIPHLISPVITSPKEASEALKKVVFEMERRYRLLAEKSARNIEGYNRLVQKSDRLPYLIVFIDELADLMFTAPTDVETAITRLAQMARASGIHLILATQRPSVDVITGLIKANFSARISFQVTSKIDSRTILDSHGAEQLLGAGDMLFMLPGIKIVRIHGAYVSESEVRAVTEFVKSQGKPDYAGFDNIVVIDEKQNGADISSERDEMYQRVIDFAESAGEVSISSIQRRLKIGYNRAARIMELLEEDGLVGPPRGAGKPRDFLGRR